MQTLKNNVSVSYLLTPVASFTKDVNLQLAKHPLKTNGHLANRGLTSLEKRGHWCLMNIS